MSEPGARFDVVVAGGALMGSAVAYFLTADPDFTGRVLVVERDPSYAGSATARSWGGIRQQFTTPENIAMSLFGAEFVKAAGARLAIGRERPDLEFREDGYLTLASPEGADALARAVAAQNRLGADIALLGPGELAGRFPWLRTDDLGAGALGLRNEGWVSPEALLHAFRRKARDLGAVYATASLASIERAAGRVSGIGLDDGRVIACSVLVDAAGSSSADIAALAGLDIPVRRRKRTTFVFDCRRTPGPLPLTIDPTGVAFRPEGGQFIAILSPPAARDRDADPGDLEPDLAGFETEIWPVLAHRVPAFEAIKLTGGWAGHYDVNTLDHNAILGPHPALDGFLICAGFSGHGLQHAPAAGRAIAELIVHGGYRSLDLSALGYARVSSRSPIREGHVV